MNYIKEQFKKITPYVTKYSAMIKISTTKDNTNWINITPEQLEQIRDILSQSPMAKIVGK